MHHVGSVPACRMREAHKDLAHSTGRDRCHVLPAGALRLRRLAVLRYDPELAAVDMDRMQNPVAPFRYSEAMTKSERLSDAVSA